MRILSRLTISFLVVALFVLMVGYYSASKSYVILKESIEKQAIVLTQEIANKIDRNLFNKIEKVYIFLDDPLLKDKLVESNREFAARENVQEYILENDKTWVGAAQGTRTSFMEDIINNQMSGRIKLRFDQHNVKQEHKEFGEVFITNRYGVNIAQTSKTSDYYQADEEWWRKAKDDGLYVSNVAYDESSRMLSIAACMRIDSDQGDFLGVIKGVINLEDTIAIVKELENRNIEEEDLVDYKLVTSTGKIMYATEDLEFFSVLSEHLMSHIIAQGRVGTFLDQGDVDKRKQEMFVFAQLEGYKYYDGLGWIVIMEYDAKKLFFSVEKFKKDLLLVSFFAALFVIALGLIVANSIADPLNKLTDMVKAVDRGEIGVKVDINTKDEMADLAKLFNEMVANLSEKTVSKEYLDNIIKSMVDSLVVINVEGKIIDANKSLVNLLGYDKKDLIGCDIKDLFSLEDAQTVSLTGGWLGRLIEEGVLKGCELNYKTKNNKEIPIVLSGSVVNSKEGQTLSIVCVAHDITNRKKSESALQAKQKELQESNADLAKNEKALRNMFFDLQKAHEDLKWHTSN
ncbi:MAG: PAS domain S-box protein [Candidatus Zapsychrus exili]|nr:PAS domain S-box protein [Candidatus Zapsychrus exili]